MPQPGTGALQPIDPAKRQCFGAMWGQDGGVETLELTKVGP